MIWQLLNMAPASIPNVRGGVETEGGRLPASESIAKVRFSNRQTKSGLSENHPIQDMDDTFDRQNWGRKRNGGFWWPAAR